MTMRVAQSEIYRNYLNNIETLNESLDTVSRQVSSGKKLTQLKDSPLSSAELVAENDQISEIDQYQSNISTGSYFLQTADSTLNEVNNLVNSVYSQGSNAASDSVSSEARSQMAVQVRSLRDQIYALANTQVRGRYLFSGSAVLKQAFSISGDDVTYGGSSATSSVTIDDGGMTVSDNIVGSAAFDSVFASIGTLATAMDGNDTTGIQSALSQVSSALSDLNQTRQQIGTNLTLLNNTTSSLSSRETNVKNRQSALEDADMAAAAVQLGQTQTALQTTISAAGKILTQNNLFDFLG